MSHGSDACNVWDRFKDAGKSHCMPNRAAACCISVCDRWDESLCGYQGQPGVSAAVYVAIGPAVLIP